MVEAQRDSGYRVTCARTLGDGAGRYLDLSHQPSGARHLHIDRDDDNSVFAVLFPTLPTDSTGEAHVLEHLIGCGSRRFAVHNAFYSMISRSLATFLNGLTTPSWTAFAFSTPNVRDYHNLTSVFLDSVFHPRLEEVAFCREAWRLELEDHHDASSRLALRGVVVNEMKGAAATPARAMELAMGRALFPDLPYAHDSGGDPAQIPSLSIDRVRAFHRRYYHPGNAFFYSYGKVPLDGILDSIDEYLSASPPREPVQVGLQARFDRPREYEVRHPCLPGDQPATAQVLLAWAVAPSDQPYERFLLKLLREVWLGDPASGLRRRLRDAVGGGRLADGSGFHPIYRQAAFGIGLKDVPADRSAALEEAALEAITERISSEDVEAAVHQVELARRDVVDAGPSQLPYAVRLLWELSSPLIYGGDPLGVVDPAAHLRRLREQGPPERQLLECARRWLVDNLHRARITMRPDPDLGQRRLEQEAHRLRELEAALGPAGRRVITERSERLRRWQDGIGQGGDLPLLGLQDIAVDTDATAYAVQRIASVPVALVPVPADGIVTLDACLDLTGLPDHLWAYLPLVAHLLRAPSADGQAGGRDRVRRSTGGIEVTLRVRNRPQGTLAPPGLCWATKALPEDLPRAVAILRDSLVPHQSDLERLQRAVRACAQRQKLLLARDYSATALAIAAARLSPAMALKEGFSGAAALKTSRHLATLDGAGLEHTRAAVDALQALLLDRSRLRICVTGPKRALPMAQDELERVLPDLARGSVAAPPGPAAGCAELAGSGADLDARVIPGSVAYNARAYRVPAFEHPDAPALLVLASHLKTGLLWREVRDMGGAYLATATADLEHGYLAVWSHRDPHIARSFAAFDRAVRLVTTEHIGTAELTMAKLDAVRMARPARPLLDRGRNRWFDDLDGYRAELRASFVQRLLRVTAADLHRSARDHLVDQASVSATLGGVQQLEEARAAWKGPVATGGL